MILEQFISKKFRKLSLFDWPILLLTTKLCQSPIWIGDVTWRVFKMRILPQIGRWMWRGVDWVTNFVFWNGQFVQKTFPASKSTRRTSVFALASASNRLQKNQKLTLVGGFPRRRPKILVSLVFSLLFFVNNLYLRVNLVFTFSFWRGLFFFFLKIFLRD